MAHGGAGVARAPVRVEDIVAQTFGVELVLPHQLPLRREGPTGPRALLCRLLFYALVEAELGPSARRPLRGRTALARWRRHVRPAERQLARQWLLGELDDQGVTVPVGWLCDQLGLDAEALAAAVRRSVGTNGRAGVTTIERSERCGEGLRTTVLLHAPASGRRHARADGADSDRQAQQRRDKRERHSEQAGTKRTNGRRRAGAAADRRTRCQRRRRAAASLPGLLSL
jgi:hypothetical protein